MRILPMIALALLLASPSHASPSADALEKAVKPFLLEHAYAKLASMCALRSEYWWESLDRSLSNHMAALAESMNASDEDRHSVTNVIVEMEASIAQPNRCRELLENPNFLIVLDRMQSQVTGGYH